MSRTMTIGKVAVTPKGAWDSTATYTKLDLVSANGASYMALGDVPAGTAVSNTTYWMPIALKGDAGNGDMLADDFSTETVYKAGQYVIYNSSLYRFVQEHAAGAWDSNEAVATNCGKEINTSYEITNKNLFEQEEATIASPYTTKGYWSANKNHEYTYSQNYLRSTSYNTDSNYHLVYSNENYKVRVIGWIKTNGVYTKWVELSAFTNSLDLTITSAKCDTFGFHFRKNTTDSLSSTDIANIKNSFTLSYSRPVILVINDVQNQIASEYDATQTYNKNSFCYKGGKLYKCISTISVAEAWNSAHWSETTVGSNVAGLLNENEKQLYIQSENINRTISYYKGYWSNNNAHERNYSSSYLCTKKTYDVTNDVAYRVAFSNENYKVRVIGWEKDGDTYSNATLLSDYVNELDILITAESCNNFAVMFKKNSGEDLSAADRDTIKGSFVFSENVTVKHVAEYYLPQMVVSETEIDTEEEKISTIAALNKNGNTVNIAFVTDIHNSVLAGSDCISVINAVQKNINLDCLVTGGDYLNNNANNIDYDTMIDQLLKMRSIFEASKTNNTLALMGNHDGDYGNIYKDEFKARFLNAFNRNAKAVMHRTGAAYMDFKDAKLRVIGLNTSDFPTESDGSWSYIPQYSSIISGEQMKWIAEEALAITESGWTVLFFAHYPLVKAVTEPYTTNNYVYVRNGSVLEEIIQARKSSENYTKLATENVTIYTGGDSYPQVSVTYDISCQYSGLPAVNIAGYVYGHVHADRMNTYNNVTYVSTDNASEWDKTKGTIEETAMDIITVNTTLKTVNFTRIGLGSDRDYTY